MRVIKHQVSLFINICLKIEHFNLNLSINFMHKGTFQKISEGK